jgi:DNA repair protein RecO (recombination protein O)
MRSFRVEGIVIKRKDFGEADRILTVFTRHQGKISVVAKGVRKINSRRSAHVELLNHCILNIHEAKLPILTEAEALNHFALLKNDLRRAGFAFYICELLDGLLPEHQESRSTFDLTESVLRRLETSENPKALIKNFEQEILINLGFWPKTQRMIEDSDAFIEDIIERKIKTKRILNLI